MVLLCCSSFCSHSWYFFTSLISGLLISANVRMFSWELNQLWNSVYYTNYCGGGDSHEQFYPLMILLLSSFPDLILFLNISPQIVPTEFCEFLIINFKAWVLNNVACLLCSFLYFHFSFSMYQHIHLWYGVTHFNDNFIHIRYIDLKVLQYLNKTMLLSFPGTCLFLPALIS